MLNVLGEHGLQMAATEDDHPVETLVLEGTSTSGHEVEELSSQVAAAESKWSWGSPSPRSSPAHCRLSTVG